VGEYAGARGRLLVRCRSLRGCWLQAGKQAGIPLLQAVLQPAACRCTTRAPGPTWPVVVGW